MRSWTTLTARRGAGRHRRLVALVLVVQLVAVALAAAFPALLAATEQNGVRQAMTESPETGLTVVADRPLGSVARTVRGVDHAVRHVIGGAARTASAVTDVSVIGSGAGPDKQAKPFLGELPERAVAVTAGTWPAPPTTDGTVPVAVPNTGAAVLGASIGSVLALRIDGRALRARVSALYDSVDRDGPIWAVDPLTGVGNDPAHLDPSAPYGAPIDVVGPLLVAPGTLDRTRVSPSRVIVAASPDFAGTSVTALESLDVRLQSIDQIVAIDTGRAAESVNAQTLLDTVVAGVLGQLLITRTTAAVAGLLLAVLAMVVLVQAALLLDAARADERALLAARGAARGQLTLLAAWEAVVSAVVVLALGVPLGAVIASAVRGAPTPPSGGSWAAGAAVAVLVVIVRLVPRLRAAERTPGRQARGTGIMRSGADLVLLALAVVLGWQLVTRRVDPSSGLDVVLVAAPAALVLAGALIALRLVPLVGRFGELVARRARGAVGALVGWELSRRSSRATATVLLVSIAVGTGAFGAISEATWRSSQLDQAALAVGAPVRVPAEPDRLPRQSALLAPGAIGAPQPVLRRDVDVTTAGADPTDPDQRLGSATVLGLPAPARAMLDGGRLRQEGGAVIARLRASPPRISGTALPAGATTLRAVVRVADAKTAIAGAAAQLRLVLEGPEGLISTVDAGLAPVDGRRHALRIPVPAPRLRLVGLQVHVLVTDPLVYRGNEPGDLALRLEGLDADGTPLRVPDGWSAMNVGGDLRSGLTLPVVRDLAANPVTGAVVGWKPVDQVGSVWTRHLLQATQAVPGGGVAFLFGDLIVPSTVVGVVTRVPGSGTTPSSAPVQDVAVTDQRTLSLFLVQSGDALPQADEWWVDVAPNRVDRYLAAHAHSGGVGADGAVALAERLTRGPLRLATTQTLDLLLAAAVALGLLGFGVDVVASLDARRREMAQLRAIGLRRGVLERMLSAESTARVAFGALLGLVLGLLLGAVAAPHLVVGPDGGPPVPAPLVVLPGAELLVLIGGAVLAALVASLLITRTFRGLDPATILREGEA